jgi:hypothetical protein
MVTAVTVAEVKEIFAQKGLHLKLPVEGSFVVKNIDVVERHIHPGGDMQLVLNIRFIDDKGKEVSDLFPCEGRIERKKPLITVSQEIPKLLTLETLPLREKFSFDSEDEARSYLKEAITHLLQDKGYCSQDKSDCDLYLEKKLRGFFINLTPRCDEEGLGRVEELIELRGRHGSDHDYGLVVPAFQEPLGISLLSQENWFRNHGEFLATHRIGAYAVNNRDPNQIFPFTIYPKERELAKYFMMTAQQWPVIRDKYVMSRAKERGGRESE